MGSCLAPSPGYIPAYETAALITKRDHPRFGHLAAVLEHDYTLTGTILVEYRNGESEIFPDEGGDVAIYSRIMGDPRLSPECRGAKDLWALEQDFLGLTPCFHREHFMRAYRRLFGS